MILCVGTTDPISTHFKFATWLHSTEIHICFNFSGVQFTEEAVQKHFDEFFADIYCELEEKVSVKMQLA